MEKNEISIANFLIEKEKNINNPNLYFYLSLINLAYYINFFPKLANEDVQRIKYYFSSLYQELQQVNLELMDIQTLDKDIMIYALLKLFLKKPVDNSFLVRSFICEVIVLESYREIANLISKKNIFTKPIKYKIDKIIASIKSIFIKKITKIRQRKIFTFQDVYDFSTKVLDNNYYNNLKKRQEIRFQYAIFQEYKDNVKDFQFFSDKNSVVFAYDKSKTKRSFAYEQYFFRDLPRILEDIENIVKNRKKENKFPVKK